MVPPWSFEGIAGEAFEDREDARERGPVLEAEPALGRAGLDEEIVEAMAVHDRVEPTIAGLVEGVGSLAAANRRAAAVVEGWARERDAAWYELAYRWETLAWRCEAYGRYTARLLGEGEPETPVRVDREAVLREELAQIAMHQPRGSAISSAALDALLRQNGMERRYPGRGTRHGRYVRGS